MIILISILLIFMLILLTGISTLLDCYICVIGQQGYVELKIGNLGKAISWSTIVC